MEREYYKKYYSLERENWWFLVRAQIIKKVIHKYINPSKDWQILNTGVATGRTSELLQESGNVTSVENDAECCRFLREELQVPVTEASVTQLPFNTSSFDIVCAFDVLEHIKEDRAAMQEINRVNKQDGWLLITVPACPWMWSVHDEVNHHYRRYKQSSIRKLLQENGYTIHYISGFNFLLFVPIAIWRLLSRLTRSKKTPVKSDFELAVFRNYSFLNKLLKGIFGLEKRIIPPVKMPFGVSIIVLAKKQ